MDEPIKIRVHLVRDSGVGPILASFPQGPPPDASLGITSSSSSSSSIRTARSGAAEEAENEKFSPLMFQYLRSTSDGRKASQRILVAANNEVRYEGKNFGDDVQQKGAYRFALGLFNRKRKRLDVYETESSGAVFGLGMISVTGRNGKIMNLSTSSDPSIHKMGGSCGAGGSATADDAAAAALEKDSSVVGGGGDATSSSSSSTSLEGASAKARRDMLIDAFGSRKKKAMERSKAANIVDVAAVAAADQVAATLRDTSKGSAAASSRAAAVAAATTTTSTTTISTTTTGGTSERKVADALAAGRRAMLPPHNMNASRPEDVYPFFDGLITAEEAAALNPSVTALFKAMFNPIAEANTLAELLSLHSRSSEYVRDRLSRIVNEAAIISAGGSIGGAASNSSSGASATPSSAAVDTTVVIKKRGGRNLNSGSGGGSSGGSSSGTNDTTEAAKADVRKRLRALLYLKCLLSLFKSSTELRQRVITARASDAGGADVSIAEGGGSGGATIDADAAASSALLGAGTEVAIPQIRWMPPAVQNRLLSLFSERQMNMKDPCASSFTDEGGASGANENTSQFMYVRTPELVDRLAVWIACLSLAVDGYSKGSDIRLLAIDMKLPPAKLVHFYRELGCATTPERVQGAGAGGGGNDDHGNEGEEEEEEGHSGSGSGKRKGGVVLSYTVKLTVPLTFPKPKIGRQRG